MADYQILAFYQYCAIEFPKREVKRHKKFLETLDARCRVYIAQNGINAQMSFASQDAKKYIDWLKEDPRFADTMVKSDPYHEHVFPKVTVKERKQLVALDENPDIALGGKHLPPEEWGKMLEKRDENTLIIDVRNLYESEIGHFEGAERPPLHSFRDFPAYAEKLTQEKDPQNTKVMMYCTGGIRCETFSALLKEKGFQNVFQLEGGVIHYGHKMGNQHWKGKLFVFDDRLSVPISEEEHPLISKCRFCDVLCDTYYNCANMDCNELFLCCAECGEKQKGTCSKKCQESERLRPYEKADRPKPFRKWYHYGKNKKAINVAECGCTE